MSDEQGSQPLINARWAVHRVRCLQQVGDVVLIQQGHHPRGEVGWKPMIGQHLSGKLDVSAGSCDEAVEFCEHRRQNHRPGPARAQEDPVPGSAGRPHGADVSLRDDPVVRVGAVEIEENGPLP